MLVWRISGWFADRAYAIMPAAIDGGMFSGQSSFLSISVAMAMHCCLMLAVVARGIGSWLSGWAM